MRFFGGYPPALGSPCKGSCRAYARLRGCPVSFRPTVWAGLSPPAAAGGTPRGEDGTAPPQRRKPGTPTRHQANHRTTPGTPPPPTPRNKTRAAAAHAAPPTGGANQMWPRPAKATDNHQAGGTGPRMRRLGGEAQPRRSTRQARRSTTPTKKPPRGGAAAYIFCVRPFITGWCGGRSCIFPAQDMNTHQPPEKRIRLYPP